MRAFEVRTFEVCIEPAAHQGCPLQNASYLRQNPSWKPIVGQNQTFEMADLLRFAGVV
jgi:hypothetical protein